MLAFQGAKPVLAYLFYSGGYQLEIPLYVPVSLDTAPIFFFKKNLYATIAHFCLHFARKRGKQLSGVLSGFGPFLPLLCPGYLFCVIVIIPAQFFERQLAGVAQFPQVFYR